MTPPPEQTPLPEEALTSLEGSLRYAATICPHWSFVAFGDEVPTCGYCGKTPEEAGITLDPG